MKNLFCFSLLLIVFANPADVFCESWLYEDGREANFAAILCHGKGGDPESYVVDPLRLELNEQLGWHTISLQMPGGMKALEEYEGDFLIAQNEINRAVKFLQKRGVTYIVLIAHSLGSRMATFYLAENPHTAIIAFIGVGMLNNGGSPFNCMENIKQTTLPILDIWGEAGLAGDSKYGLERKLLVSSHYTQVSIPGGDHALSEHEDELVVEVISWIRLLTKRK